MEFDVDNLRHRRADQRWNRVSIGDLFERVRWSRPDATALVGRPGAFESEDHRRLTYEQADVLANRVANALAADGLCNGDIVLLFCENSVEAVVTKIAMAKAGVVAAPVNPSLAPDVVAQLVDTIGPAAVIADAHLLPALAPLLDEKGVRTCFSIAVGADAPAGVATFGEYVVGFDDREPATTIHGDDIWQLLFTSGSTAAPKAVMVSHTNSYMSASAWSTLLGRGLRTERDVVLGTGLPMVYHVGDTLLYAAFLDGGSIVLDRRPDPVATARMVSEEAVTTLWGGMPQFLRGVAEAFEADPSLSAGALQTVAFGWAPLDPSLFDRFQMLAGHEVFFTEILGQTEVVVAHRFWVNEYEELFRRTAPDDNYVGAPHPLLGARIDNGTDAGEIVYRSPALTHGYFRDEDATRKAFEGGWFHSGDIFRVGESGQRIMVDRAKDVIKTGGENVSSIRVETVLETHRSVGRAAVVGVPDERWGEAVTAVVVASGEVTDTELIEYCKTKIAKFEVPKRIVFVVALPVTVGGKLQKHLIRALPDVRNPEVQK